ncbi:ubiquilin-1-like isoform 2-T2 [Odontesthes bonariensis]|uniref:ubiquilin-1-like isoform X2 n=1 Tax=Odontesthes bonariensis TaxID=219752 RepID=UPI003F586195
MAVTGQERSRLPSDPSREADTSLSEETAPSDRSGGPNSSSDALSVLRLDLMFPHRMMLWLKYPDDNQCRCCCVFGLQSACYLCLCVQLKWVLSERLGASAEQLVLIHSGRVLRESELISHIKRQNGSVKLCMIQRPQPISAQPLDDSTSERVKSEVTAPLNPDPTLTTTPTSPLCLVEGLESLGLENSESGFFPAIQRQMESQLIQQVLQTNPDAESILNTDVINQVLELIRNPEMIEGVMQNEDGALDDPEAIPGSSDIFQKMEAKTHQPSGKLSQSPEVHSKSTPPPSSDSTDPLRELTATPTADPRTQNTITAGMQSLLEEITASPGLMESLLCGPYVSSLLNCLSHNPDLAAQMLLSHPLFSGNPQLQQQMRQEIPLFLQQMQSPELLSVMLNPRATEALLQIQQGLQTLAAEAPSLLPTAGPGTSGASVNEAPGLASDCALNSQSESGIQVATVTEQQQKFVQQMLQALANTNNEVRHEEDEFQKELEQLSSIGFRDRQANLQALISSGGDLSTAIQHLLSL